MKITTTMQHLDDADEVYIVTKDGTAYKFSGILSLHASLVRMDESTASACLYFKFPSDGIFVSPKEE